MQINSSFLHVSYDLFCTLSDDVSSEEMLPNVSIHFISRLKKLIVYYLSYWTNYNSIGYCKNIYVKCGYCKNIYVKYIPKRFNLLKFIQIE